MSNLTKSRRENRMESMIDSKILSDRGYNIALGTNILYGLLVNIILCIVLGDTMKQVNPVFLIIGYFICCLIGICMSSVSTNPIISFIGYNLVVIPIGLVLSTTISEYTENNLGYIVEQAIVLTTIITFIMIALSIAFPNFFSKLGTLLFACLFGLLTADLISIIFFPVAINIISWIGAIIFSLYIGFDFWRSQQYPKTLDNAIDCALDIYLDIINLFVRLLQILSNSKSSSSK